MVQKSTYVERVGLKSPEKPARRVDLFTVVMGLLLYVWTLNMALGDLNIVQGF